jgi:anti-sigma factor RsiW
MNCISESMLRAYHDGEVDANHAREVESHLANCSACANRLEEIVAAAAKVQAEIAGLDAGVAQRGTDPYVALARFKAQNEPAAAQQKSFSSLVFARRWRPAWVAGAVAAMLLLSLVFPAGRSLAQRFLATLRIEKVQPLAVDFSALDGNRPLGEMISKMLSDKVVVTADEKMQHVDSAEVASKLAGFPVKMLGTRADAPKFNVEGQHAFHLTIDRDRVQDILDQAGRPDLLLPAGIDGATVSVNIPRAIGLEYGDCTRQVRAEGAAPARTPQERHEWGQSGTAANSCVAIIEAPAPEVSVPADLNIQQLAEIGFQLARMNPTQARELAQTIDWKSTLVLPIPRMAGTYTQVQLAGAQGTLINAAGRRDPHYVLIWVKNGIIYGLIGQGDSSDAVALANSLN